MKNRFKGTKGTIILIVLVFLVISYYYYLSNKTNPDKNEEAIKVSSAQEIILKNYTINYPPTPKEVVKEFLQISKVLHNENLSDEEINGIAMKVRELYDDEFIANKSDDEYLKDLKSEIATFRDNDYAITNYYTSSSTDVVYDTVDGYKFAKLYGTFSIRTGKESQLLQEVFLLRKDAAGHWKIYGWQPVEASDE
ncbi:MAG: hypothetical protein J5525_00535 [Lachnospiraceae bacterium]|nr:hypothetical protein [Lachnospiraceae bacterium]